MGSLSSSPNESRIASMIDGYWEKKAIEEKARPETIPADLIGHPCSRYLWLSFRWACWQQSRGAEQRKAEQAQKEAESAISILEQLGMKFSDGLVTGVPEAEATVHLFVFELLTDTAFQLLQSKGLKDALPMSYSALQYRLLDKADRALYIAENRNTAELIAFRIRLDENFAESLREKGESIISSSQIPAKHSEDDECTVCKDCDYYTFCHFWKRPDVNCRTCSHFFADRNGEGMCALFDNSAIPIENQRKGCECHVMKSDLVDWQLDESRSSQYVGCYYIPDLGKTLFNGFGGVATTEIMKEIWQHDTAERLSDTDNTIYF